MNLYFGSNNHSANNKNFDRNPINHEYPSYDENDPAPFNNSTNTPDIL
jgi:hypothetical protein